MKNNTLQEAYLKAEALSQTVRDNATWRLSVIAQKELLQSFITWSNKNHKGYNLCTKVSADTILNFGSNKLIDEFTNLALKVEFPC